MNWTSIGSLVFLWKINKNNVDPEKWCFFGITSKIKLPRFFPSIYALIWLFPIIWAKDGLSACDSLAARAMGSCSRHSARRPGDVMNSRAVWCTQGYEISLPTYLTIVYVLLYNVNFGNEPNIIFHHIMNLTCWTCWIKEIQRPRQRGPPRPKNLGPRGAREAIYAAAAMPFFASHFEGLPVAYVRFSLHRSLLKAFIKVPVKTACRYSKNFESYGT